MKISKLFHWLYAILMFLPIMVFIPNAFYYGFNEHAVAQEKTEQVPIYYESNDILTIDDFIIGNVYSWNDNFNQYAENDSYFYLNIKVLSGTLIDIEGRLFKNATGYMYLYINSSTFYGIGTNPFDFLVLNLENGLSHMPQIILEKFSKTNAKYVKEYQPLVTNMSITDSMSYAWDSVWQNDLFSWSYGSFLTQPFLYITNLFNVPPTNTLLYCLSYWLNISIIWLTFDVIMYVPLLVHRWIDKGIVE